MVVMHLGKMSVTVLPMFIINPSQEHLKRHRREEREMHVCLFSNLSAKLMTICHLCGGGGGAERGEI